MSETKSQTQLSNFHFHTFISKTKNYLTPKLTMFLMTGVASGLSHAP